MSKPKEIPISEMQELSGSEVFIKRFCQYGNVKMRSYAHRDDYYIVALLTDGSAAVEIDFERKELHRSELLIVSPRQVHNKPEGESWHADGWLLAFAPELLSEEETMALEVYSISPRPLNPGESTANDIDTLCSMLERNRGNTPVVKALACAVKSLVLSRLDSSEEEGTGRYKAITLRLRNLLDLHLRRVKGPSVYASMLNISEVYLNEAVKGATGLSAGEYIRRRAIVEAKRQLAYTSLPAKQIAYALGYEDYSYFSKLFRKIAGQSTAEYRKNLK